MIRTFLAADLDAAFLDEAAAWAEHLRGGALSKAKATWVARASMHVTLRFYGPTPADRCAALAALPRALARIVTDDAWDLRVRALDAFPSAVKARVLVLRFDDDVTLAEIARRAEAHAVGLGFAPETRTFRPHLTLARLRAPADLRDVATDTPALSRARVTAITLYESKTLPTGPVYTPIARISTSEIGNG